MPAGIEQIAGQCIGWQSLRNGILGPSLEQMVNSVEGGEAFCNGVGIPHTGRVPHSPRMDASPHRNLDDETE
jgi:hypothetical protein